MSIHNYDRRAELGVDGNCGYALLGEDIQTGECEFVEVKPPTKELTVSMQQSIACKRALLALRERLNDPTLSFYFGSTHPFNS